MTACLKRLGFPNKLAFSSAKKAGLTSMKSSFCIWLARNSKQWSQDLLSSPAVQSSPAKSNKAKYSLPSIPKDISEASFITSTRFDSNAAAIRNSGSISKHAGLVNKDNTCYANIILQALSVIPSVWSQSPSEGPCPPPLVKALSLNMSLLSCASSHVDPSNFLRLLQQKISVTNASFNFNTQQDVSEILKVLLDEFKGLLTLAEEVFSTTLQSTISCDVCLCSSVKEDKYDILTLPTTKHISSSLDKLLQSESLSGDNMWFCPQCSSSQNATTEAGIVKCGSVLILQLKRYDTFLGNVYKDTKFVECLPCSDHLLKIPVLQNDVMSFSNEYTLVASINHSGSLNAGHYWAYIKENKKDLRLENLRS